MGLGQGVAQMQGAVRIGRGRVEQGLQLREEVALRRLFRQLHPGGPGAVEAGLQGQGLGIGGLRGREVAGELARGRQVVEEAGLVRGRGDSRLEERQGPDVIPRPGEDHAQGVEGERVGRRQGHGLGRRRQGLGPPVQGDQGAGQIGVVPRRPRRQLHGLGEPLGGADGIVVVGGDHPQQEPGAALGCVLAQGLQARFVRLLIGLAGHQRLGAIQQFRRFSHLVRPLSMRRAHTFWPEWA